MEELRARYEKDGYLVMEGLMKPEEVELLRQETLKICRNETSATFFGRIEAPPSSDQEALDRYLCVHFPHKISEPIKEIVAHHEPTNAVLRALIGSPNVKACQSMLFVKPPGDPGQAWHQDEYFIPTEDHSLTANWIPLDDTDVQNGCLWVWPGSHREMKLFPHRPHNLPHYDFAQMASDHGYPESAAVPVPMKAGDVLFFHGHILHRSLENKHLPGSGRYRRVLTNHYLSADALLPWQGEEDNRDVILCCGVDRYAYKGTVEKSKPFVRPRKSDAAYMKAMRKWHDEEVGAWRNRADEEEETPKVDADQSARADHSGADAGASGRTVSAPNAKL